MADSFTIDTSATDIDAAPEVKTWTCDVCQLTITVREDGAAITQHINGKNHQKRLRKRAAEAGDGSSTAGVGGTQDNKKRKLEATVGAGDSSAPPQPPPPPSSKALLNNFVQHKPGWLVKYEVTSEGEQHALTFRAEVTLHRPDREAPASFVGELQSSKKAAEIAAATVCMDALKGEGAMSSTGEVPEGEGTSSARLAPGRVKFLMLQELTADGLIRLYLQHVGYGGLRFEHLACAWSHLAKLVKGDGGGSGGYAAGHESRGFIGTVSATAGTLRHLWTAQLPALVRYTTDSLRRPLAPPGPSPDMAWQGGLPPPSDACGAREVANVVYGAVVALGLPGDGRREFSPMLDACASAALALVDGLNAQELSNAVWALSKANHSAPAFFEAAAAKATAWLAEQSKDDATLWGNMEDTGHVFKTQELTNLIYSVARSSHRAPGLFAAFAAHVDSGNRRGAAALRSWSVRDLCNALWALAAADARHVKLVEACCDALGCLTFDWDRAHLTQLQQWLVWWEFELGRRPPPWVIPELRERCRASLAAGDEAHGHTISAFQRSVEMALRRLRMPTVSEHTTAEGYSIDLALPERRVAIEVDGPHHFSQPPEYVPSGATVIKRRQLRALGWNLIAIPFYEWYALEGKADAEECYLQRALKASLPA